MSMSARLGRAVGSVGCAALLMGAVMALPSQALAVQRADGCASWQACRDAALAAEEAKEFERFHDLAWRTAQLGPKDDPATMYLLARAQVTSGRPSDALVMLRRLAQMGVATDADVLDEFARLRDREGWLDVEVMTRTAPRRVTKDLGQAMEAPGGRLATDASAGEPAAATARGRLAPDPAPAATTAPASARPVATPVSAARVMPALRSTEALRLNALPVASGGFAYDAVSGRFLVGSATERKIVVVDEPSRRASDLVRGDSAGFRNIAAMQIDTRRGDLWVVSNEGGSATLHKLQLVAGRPLASVEAAAVAGALRFTDLTVSPNGSVLLVDAEGRRLFRASPRATALEPVASLEHLSAPVAIASANGDGVAYVAHADGIARFDLALRATVAVGASADVPLDAIERLWWHDGGLVVLRTLASGDRVMQRLELDRRGTTVVSVQAIDVELPDASASLAATLSGDDLFVMTDDHASATSGNGGPVQVVVRRVRLRP